MEPQEIRHYQIGTKYRVQFERSAVKGVDGFKVEANGDELEQIKKDAYDLYCDAIKKTASPTGEPPKA